MAGQRGSDIRSNVWKMVKISLNTRRALSLKVMIFDVVDRYQDFGVVYCLYVQSVRLGDAVVVKGLDTAGYPRLAQAG